MNEDNEIKNENKEEKQEKVKENRAATSEIENDLESNDTLKQQSEQKVEPKREGKSNQDSKQELNQEPKPEPKQILKQNIDTELELVQQQKLTPEEVKIGTKSTNDLENNNSNQNNLKVPEFCIMPRETEYSSDEDTNKKEQKNSNSIKIFETCITTKKKKETTFNLTVIEENLNNITTYKSFLTLIQKILFDWHTCNKQANKIITTFNNINDIRILILLFSPISKDYKNFPLGKLKLVIRALFNSPRFQDKFKKEILNNNLDNNIEQYFDTNKEIRNFYKEYFLSIILLLAQTQDLFEQIKKLLTLQITRKSFTSAIAWDDNYIKTLTQANEYFKNICNQMMVFIFRAGELNAYLQLPSHKNDFISLIVYFKARILLEVVYDLSSFSPTTQEDLNKIKQKLNKNEVSQIYSVKENNPRNNSDLDFIKNQIRDENWYISNGIPLGFIVAFIPFLQTVKDINKDENHYNELKKYAPYLAQAIFIVQYYYRHAHNMNQSPDAVIANFIIPTSSPILEFLKKRGSFNVWNINYIHAGVKEVADEKYDLSKFLNISNTTQLNIAIIDYTDIQQYAFFPDWMQAVSKYYDIYEQSRKDNLLTLSFNLVAKGSENLNLLEKMQQHILALQNYTYKVTVLEKNYSKDFYSTFYNKKYNVDKNHNNEVESNNKNDITTFVNHLILHMEMINYIGTLFSELYALSKTEIHLEEGWQDKIKVPDLLLKQQSSLDIANKFVLLTILMFAYHNEFINKLMKTKEIKVSFEHNQLDLKNSRAKSKYTMKNIDITKLALLNDSIGQITEGTIGSKNPNWVITGNKSAFFSVQENNQLTVNFKEEKINENKSTHVITALIDAGYSR